MRTKRVVCGRSLVFAALLLSAAIVAHGRTLEEIKSRGLLSLCANPDSLPYASSKANPPGFQVEIGNAIAQALGVSLETAWIVPAYRANRVNCDIVLDAFNDPAVHEGKLMLSKPYQRSGVALGVADDNGAVKSFSDLKPGQRVGVMVGSLAQTILGKRGLTTIPYSFEEDMIEDLARGDLYATASSPARVAYYRHANPQKPLKLVHAYDSEPELAWTVAVGMRKADDALVEAMNDIITRLVEDGTLKRIYANYGVEHRAP